MGKLGNKEVQLYENDRIPHATKKCLDNLHVNAELHRGRYAGKFYQNRQSGPGMESGTLQVPAKDLAAMGDNLRLFCFIESIQMGVNPNNTGGCTYKLVFNPNDKKTLLKMISDRVGEQNFTYQMTSTASRTATQAEQKALLRTLRISHPNKKLICLDSLSVYVICDGIKRNDIGQVTSLLATLGRQRVIINRPLDSSGITMLHYAAMNFKYEILYYLLQNGAKKENMLTDKRTALDVVKSTEDSCADKEICVHLLQDTELLKAVKEKAWHYAAFAVRNWKPDLCAKDILGMTPLHYAFKCPSYEELVTLMVSAGAELYAETKLGIRPMDIAKESVPKKLQTKLASIYKKHPQRLVGKAPKLNEKKKKQPAERGPKMQFWGQSKPVVTEKKQPDPQSLEFTKWYDGHAGNWGSYVTLTSKK